MKRALVIACLLISSCASTPQARSRQPCNKPVEAMQHKAMQMCQLRPEFVDMELKDQAAMVLNCRIVDAEDRRRLELDYNAVVAAFKRCVK